MPERAAQPEPPLIDAIKSRDEARVRQLLAEGADPNTTSSDGRPALSFASRTTETALALIDAGANLKPHVGREFNAVWAASTGRADLVARVLDAGADPNVHTYSGTPVHVAARSGHAGVVKLLIERGADVNAGTMIGTPLSDAVERKQTECAVLLLKAGAAPKAKFAENSLLALAAHNGDAALVDALLAAGAPPDERGKVMQVNPVKMQAADLYANATALLIAARRGDLPIVESLLKAGANLTLRDENGRRPLDLAREHGDADVVARIEAALKNFPDASDPNEDLLLAAETGDADAAKSLLSRGADPNARDARTRSKDATPLLLALRNGHAEIARLLLDAGADPNLHDALDPQAARGARNLLAHTDADTIAQMGARLGHTALAEAAARGEAEMASLLLARGAAVDARDVLGQTPLMLAAGNGPAGVVRLLLSAGADPNAADAAKAPALQAAVNGKNPDVVEALLLAGAKPAGKAAAEMLHSAADAGRVEMIRALLRAGVKVDAPAYGRRTPLFSAAGRARVDAIRVLLESGADVNHREKDGGTALHAAAHVHARTTTYQDGEEIVDEGPPPEDVLAAVGALLDAGADVNAADESGFTPLGWAVAGANAPLIRLLLDRGAHPAVGRMAGQSLVEYARGREGAIDPDTLARIEQAASSAPPPAPAPAAKPAPAKKKKKKKDEEGKPEKRPADPAPPPDFSAALDRRDYRDAVAEMEKRCGTKAIRFEHLPGAFHLHVHSQSGFDFDKARADMLARGCTVVWVGSDRKQQVGLFPTTDVFEVLRAMDTNGDNYGLGPDDVAAWLRELHAEQPFEITALAFDTVEGHFLGPIKDPKRLARRMYKFCPDIVDQGIGSVAAVAESLKEDRPRLYFWWD